jgi:hypothetical protein
MHVFALLPLIPETSAAVSRTFRVPALTVSVLAFDDLDARTAYDM